MFACYLIKRWFPEYLFGELSPNNLLKFNKHIQTCKSCYRELQDMQDTVGIISQHDIQIEYPTELDWEHFTIKLHTRLAGLQAPVRPPKYRERFFNWLRKTITPQPTWATSLAAVATLILLIFQGAIISNTFISNKRVKPGEISIMAQKQNRSYYEQSFEQRIALTKYVYEKTNS